MKTMLFLLSFVSVLCLISCKKSGSKASGTAGDTQSEKPTETKSELKLIPNTKPVIPTKKKQVESDCLLNGMYYSEGTTYGKLLCQKQKWIKQQSK